MLHNLRGAMISPERELLKGELDRRVLARAGTRSLKGRGEPEKALCGAALEVVEAARGRLASPCYPTPPVPRGAFTQAIGPRLSGG
jgi:hypothetical protein